MMEPIISPWVIYFISVLSNLCIVFRTIMVVSILLLLVLFIMYLLDLAGGVDEDKYLLKLIRYSTIATSVSVFLVAVLPDKNVLISMLVLQYVTPDNIQAVQGDIVKFVGDVISATKSIMEKQ